MSDPMDCRHAQLNAAELALGVLVGSERSASLTHLETCAECRAEVGRFAAATDAVLQLAPVADPPAGFEVRLLARRAAARRAEASPASPFPGAPFGRRRRLLRPGLARPIAGIAAAVLLAAGVAIGVLAAPSSTDRSTPMRAAALAYDGSSRGEVAVALGRPAWMIMTVDLPRWSGWVRCVVIEDGGRHVTVGTFWLEHGHGGWATKLHMPGTSVTGAILEADDGHTMASARLPG